MNTFINEKILWAGAVVVLVLVVAFLLGGVYTITPPSGPVDTAYKMNRFTGKVWLIKTYSKGMQQRTAIAAALIHDPELVVLDEPMSGLDPLGRKLIFDLIAELKAQGKTVFISSHVLTDIERLCDRVGIIVQGRLCYEGRVDQLSAPLDDLFLRVVQEAGLEEVR